MATISKPSLLPFAYEHIVKMFTKYKEFRNAYAPFTNSHDYENSLDISKMWMLANGIDSDKAATWISRLAYLSLVVVGMIDVQHPIKEPNVRFGINFDNIPAMGFYLNHVPGGIAFIRKFWKTAPDYHGLKKMCIDDDYTVKTDGKLFVALLPKYMLCKIFETEPFEEAYKLYATCAIGSIDDNDATVNADDWPIIDLGSVIKEIE